MVFLLCSEHCLCDQNICNEKALQVSCLQVFLDASTTTELSETKRIVTVLERNQWFLPVKNIWIVDFNSMCFILIRDNLVISHQRRSYGGRVRQKPVDPVDPSAMALRLRLAHQHPHQHSSALHGGT